MTHYVRLLCDSRDSSSIITDELSRQLPFSWSGNAFNIQIALAVGPTFLTSADIGSIALEIKPISADPTSAPLVRKVYGSSDCNAAFTGAQWEGNVESLLVASFTAAEASIGRGRYRLIVIHTTPTGEEVPHLSTAFEVTEDYYSGPSVLVPPTTPTEYYTREESDVRFSPATGGAVTGGAGTTTHVVMIGQSNARRTNFDVYGVGSYDVSNDTRVQLLNSSDEFVTYDLSIAGISDHIGTPSSNSQNTSTIAYHFGKEVARKTGNNVKIVASTLGGQSLDHWGINTAGDTHDPTAAGWVVLLDQLSHIPSVEVVLFHQGETLGGRTQAQQLAGLKLLFIKLRETGKINADTPIIAGEIINTNQAGNLALIDLENDNEWRQFTLVERPGGAPLADNLHYTADQIVDFGHRYAHAALSVGSSTVAENADTLVFKGRNAFSSPQTKTKVSLSCAATGTYRGKYRISLQQRQTNQNAIADLEVVVHRSSNGGVWSHHILNGNSSGETGVSVELINKTTTGADLVIHHTQPLDGPSWWGVSVVSIGDDEGEKAADTVPALPFTPIVTTENETEAKYGVGGAAPNQLKVTPTPNFLELGNTLIQGTSNNYKKYRLSISEPSGRNYLAKYRFECRAIETAAKMRAVFADIYVSKWSGSSLRNIGIGGVKIAGLGVKVDLENQTSTSYDIVVHLTYDQSQSTYSWAAQFAVFNNIDAHTPTHFSGYLEGDRTATSQQEVETDNLYHPGGSGASDF